MSTWKYLVFLGLVWSTATGFPLCFPLLLLPFITMWLEFVNGIIFLVTTEQIDPSHKSHHTLDNVPHCSILQQKYAHECTSLLQNDASWDMGLVHCGICITGSIGSPCMRVGLCFGFITKLIDSNNMKINIFIERSLKAFMYWLSACLLASVAYSH